MTLLPLLLTLVTSASANEPALLNLSSTIKQGLVYSLEVKKAESQQKSAAADYRVAESSLFPEINAVASGGTQKSSAAYRSGTTTSTLDTNETYKAQLELTQPLYQGGAISSALSGAKLSRDIYGQLLYSARQNYTYDLINAYYQAAQSQLTLELAKENRETLKAYARITAQYASIGRSKNIDRLQAQANYNLSEAEVLNSESNFESDLEALFRLMGKNKGPNDRLDTNLVLQPVETGTLEQLYKKSLENNPVVRSLEMSVETQRYLNDVNMAVHKPSVFLRGTWGYDSPDQENLFEKRAEAYSLTLNLKIPLFSGLSSIGQRTRNRESLVQAEKDLSIKQRDLQKSLAQALSTLSRDFNRLKLTQESATSARKAMDVAIRDYRNGLLSSTDVLSIQRTRFDADRQYLTAQYSYHRQVLTLRRDLGVDLEKAYAK